MMLKRNSLNTICCSIVKSVIALTALSQYFSKEAYPDCSCVKATQLRSYCALGSLDTAKRSKRSQGTNNLKLFQYALLSSALLLPSTVLATQTTTKPLYISSNSTIINFHDGESFYQGHVIAKHNGSVLTGNNLTAYENKQHKVNKVVTNGKPATLFAKAQAGKPALHAHAETIIFYPLKHEALFRTKAFAEQGHDIIQGNLITYNTKTKVLTSTSKPHHRVHILLDDATGKNS
jgi:lipopolysaccharide transport protein LptA